MGKKDKRLQKSKQRMKNGAGGGGGGGMVGASRKATTKTPVKGKDRRDVKKKPEPERTVRVEKKKAKSNDIPVLERQRDPDKDDMELDDELDCSPLTVDSEETRNTSKTLKKALNKKSSSRSKKRGGSSSSASRRQRKLADSDDASNSGVHEPQPASKVGDAVVIFSKKHNKKVTHSEIHRILADDISVAGGPGTVPVNQKPNPVDIPVNPAICAEVYKIRLMNSQVKVLDEAAINGYGYYIERTKICSSDFALLVHGKRRAADQEEARLAVKIFNLTEFSPEFRRCLAESIKILRYISDYNKEPLSPEFLRFYEAFEVAGSKLCIFLELADSTTLYDLVKNSQGHIDVEEVRNYVRAITGAIDTLQAIGVAHRYLKLQHVCLDVMRQPKLCGWSKAVLFVDSSKKKVILQPPERRVRRNDHLPPEAFEAAYDPSKADIWSIGVLLVAMSAKRYPFNVRDSGNKFSKQWRAFVERHALNTYIRNLCNKIFVIEPRQRMATKKILKDWYFTAPRESLAPLSIRGDLLEREPSKVGGTDVLDFDSFKSAPHVKDGGKEPTPQPSTDLPPLTPTQVSPAKSFNTAPSFMPHPSFGADLTQPSTGSNASSGSNSGKVNTLATPAPKEIGLPMFQDGGPVGEVAIGADAEEENEEGEEGEGDGEVEGGEGEGEEGEGEGDGDEMDDDGQKQQQ